MPLSKFYKLDMFVFYLVNSSHNCSIHFPFFNSNFSLMICLLSVFSPLWLCTLMMYVKQIITVNTTDMSYVYNIYICIHIYTTHSECFLHYSSDHSLFVGLWFFSSLFSLELSKFDSYLFGVFLISDVFVRDSFFGFALFGHKWLYSVHSLSADAFLLWPSLRVW